MRLVITSVAVALGVGLLLVTLAALNAVGAQNERWAWLNSGIAEAVSPQAVRAPDPLWGSLSSDQYQGKEIIRVDVAATGPHSPVLPGLAALPGPGQFYVSPAVDALLRSQPPAQFADRYPGTRLGVITKAGLPSPDSLIVVVGRTVDEVSHLPGSAKVSAVADRSPGTCRHCQYGYRSDAIALILSVTAAALLFPILIFIGTATRLAAARREQRFAAMRLVGATPRQVSVVSAVESSVAAVTGTALGFAVFLLFRSPLSRIPVTGDRFYPADLTLSLRDIVLVGAGVPVAAVLSAWISLRRVQISPLGVTRQVTPKPPRAYRVIPLILGLGELAYFVGRRPPTTNGQIQAYLTGIFVTMAGLVIAGPWLTMVGSRLIARRTANPAMLIAGRRLSDNPKAGFRAISGLVLALFVTSSAVGAITTEVAQRGVPTGDQNARSTLVLDFSNGWTTVEGVPRDTVSAVPATLSEQLSSVSGVHTVSVIHTNPIGTTIALGGPTPVVAGLVSCGPAHAVAGFGACAPGADVVSVPPVFSTDPPFGARPGAGWSAAPISSPKLAALPVQTVIVGTDGSPVTLEKARTVLEAAFPGRWPAQTMSERRAQSATARQLAGYQQLAEVVILVSLGVAGCGLAVSVVGSLNDRKRPFSLLRLTGVRLSTLRSVVALESVVPLLVNAVLAIGTGFLAAGLFLRSQQDYALAPPGPDYYVTVLLGLAVSLGVIASTLPLLRRITGPESARNE